MLDILIRNGQLIDGTGNPSYPVNVAIEGDRIVQVGRLEGPPCTPGPMPG